MASAEDVLADSSGREAFVKEHLARKTAMRLLADVVAPGGCASVTERALLKLFPDAVPEAGFAALGEALRASRLSRPALFLDKLRNCALNAFMDEKAALDAIWCAVTANWFPAVFPCAEFTVPVPVLLTSVLLRASRFTPKHLRACAAIARFICEAALTADPVAESVADVRTVFVPGTAALLHVLAFTPLDASCADAVMDVLTCVRTVLHAEVDWSRGCARGCSCTGDLYTSTLFVAQEAAVARVWAHMDALARIDDESARARLVPSITCAQSRVPCPASALNIMAHFPTLYALDASCAASLNALLDIGSAHALCVALFARPFGWTLDAAQRVCADAGLASVTAAALDAGPDDAALGLFFSLAPDVRRVFAGLELSDRVRLHLCKFLDAAAEEYTFTQCFARFRTPAARVAAFLDYCASGGSLAAVSPSDARSMIGECAHANVLLPAHALSQVAVLPDCACGCDDPACTQLLRLLVTCFQAVYLCPLLQCVTRLCSSDAQDRVRPLLLPLASWFRMHMLQSLTDLDMQCACAALLRLAPGSTSHPVEIILDALLQTGSLSFVIVQGTALLSAAAHALASSQLQRLVQLCMVRVNALCSTHSMSLLAIDVYDELLRLLNTAPHACADSAVFWNGLAQLFRVMTNGNPDVTVNVQPVLVHHVRTTRLRERAACNTYMRQSNAAPDPILVLALLETGHAVTTSVLGPAELAQGTELVGDIFHWCGLAISRMEPANLYVVARVPAVRALFHCFAKMRPALQTLLLRIVYEPARDAGAEAEWIIWNAEARLPMCTNRFEILPTEQVRVAAASGSGSMAEAAQEVLDARRVPLQLHPAGQTATELLAQLAIRPLLDSDLERLIAVETPADRFVLIACMELHAATTSSVHVLRHCIEHGSDATRLTAWRNALRLVTANHETNAIVLLIASYAFSSTELWAAFQAEFTPVMASAVGKALVCTFALFEDWNPRLLRLLACQGCLSDAYTAALLCEEGPVKTGVIVREIGPLTSAAYASTCSTPTEPCGICYEPLHCWRVADLSCKHEFHIQCLQQWFARSMDSDMPKQQCPICRADHVGTVTNAFESARACLTTKGLLYAAALQTPRLWTPA